MNKFYREAIFIGSRNPFKKTKLKWLIEKYFSKIDSPDNLLTFSENVPERGKSFVEVAANKARFISKIYPGYVITSDSGVDIPALGSNWNALKTKRFIKKKNATDFERMDALLKLMNSKEGQERTIYWKEAIAIAKDGKVIYTTEAKSCPMLLQKTYNPKKYQEGIWLCSLFYYPQYGKNYFDLTKEELELDGEDTWWELKNKVESFLDYKKSDTDIRNKIYTFDLTKYSLAKNIFESLKYNIVVPYISNHHHNNLSKRNLFKKPIISPYDVAAAIVGTKEDLSIINPKILLSRITINISKSSKKATFSYNDGFQVRKINLSRVPHKNTQLLLDNNSYLSYISAYLKSLLSKHFTILSFNALGSKTNTFIIDSTSTKLPINKLAKVHINDSLDKNDIRKISNAVILNEKLLAQQANLLHGLESKEVIVSNSINLIDHWPKNPYIENIKRQVERKIKELLSSSKAAIDWRDLLLQVLFRTTTYSPRNLFYNGSKLLLYLESCGVFENWQNIPLLSESELRKYTLNTDLIDEIINEQIIIALNRFSQSQFNVKKFFNKMSYFNGNWKMVWQENKLFITDGHNFKKILFKPVDPNLASAIHNQFHYIHAPRATAAFGLFIEGSQYPFSVESVEYVKRNYKKNGLLLFGYNPLNCIELTRLYNRPFSPIGTSSLIDKMIFHYYNREHPEVEAVSTTIMPDYAFSKSQIAGPVSHVYLITKGKHTFIEKKINSQTVYELVTNKKIEGERLYSLIQSHPKTPLLPVFQVLYQIGAKSFTEAEGLENKMIELT